MSDDEEFVCSHCGGESFFDDYVDGKCISCIVNDCNHTNNEEIDSHRGYKSPFLTLRYICMDCEVSWTVAHKLEGGTVSKFDHESCNPSEINDD
jgi:hypothetical protein